MYNKNIFLWLCVIIAAPQLFATQPNPQTLGEQNQSAQTKFWENKGQIKDHNQQAAHFVKFGYESGNTQVFLLETGLAYQFSKLHFPEGYQHDSKNLSPDARKINGALREKIRLETFRMDMQLVDANPNPRISREGKSTDYINYYNHNVLGVHGYEKVTYHEIYQGVDWVIYTNKEGLKYDFVVRPNADISRIKMRFEHQENLRLNADGSFTLSNAMGTITEQAPVSFQSGKEIATRFVLNGNELSFAIANYDPSQPLTIDPSVLWATYYGESAAEKGNACVVDANSNVYLAGITGSSSAIASGGHQNTYGNNTDAFLVKFNSAGVRQWATYYGGNSVEDGFSCAVDASGNIYLAGRTQSNSAIASGGHQNTLGGSTDAFLVKFNSTGVRQWATYYGGTNPDIGLACAVDASGNVYLAGYTPSANAIASGGHQNTYGGSTDAFLVKFGTPCVSITGSFSQTICAGQSFFFNGLNRNTSGAYLDTLVSTNGCDSFLTLNLTVLPIQTGSISQTICSNQSFFFNGLNRNTSGTYLDTLVAANGCDSILTLNLTVLPIRTGSFSQTICAGQSFLFNGVNLTTSGAYLDTLVTSNGCDSFLILNLTVLTVDISVTNNGNSLTANNNNNASYQWINCSDNSLIINETNQTFTPNGNGVYAVIVSESNCVDTSACITITSLENYNKNSFSVFPNPTNDIVNITFSQTTNKTQINLYNSIGQLVYTQKFTNNAQQFSFSLSPLPVGVYWLSIQDQNGQIYTQKIVRE